jgi:hypothetical protein
MSDNFSLRREWVPLKVRLSPSLKKQLDERAFLKGIPESAMLSEVLAYYFDHETEIQGDLMPASEQCVTDLSQWKKLHGSRHDRSGSLLGNPGENVRSCLTRDLYAPAVAFFSRPSCQ